MQSKINVEKKLNFGETDLVLAIPDNWIDVQTVADLEEVAFDIRSKRNRRLRVATKYPNLTKNFLFSKGVTQFKLVMSLGATETYPFIGSSEIISDITSTGKTLKDNELRVLKDGIILNSTACLLYSKKLKKRLGFKMMIDFFKRLNKKEKKRFQNNIDKIYLDPLKIDYKNFIKFTPVKKITNFPNYVNNMVLIKVIWIFIQKNHINGILITIRFFIMIYFFI